jgi:hypothetical protein
MEYKPVRSKNYLPRNISKLFPTLARVRRGPPVPCYHHADRGLNRRVDIVFVLVVLTLRARVFGYAASIKTANPQSCSLTGVLPFSLRGRPFVSVVARCLSATR